MPDPERLPHVHEDEQDAHGDRRNGEQFSEEHDFLDRLEIVQVGGHDEQDGGGSHAHQEGEVRDVQAPGDLVPHGGRDQTPVQLVDICAQSQEHEEGQERHPEIIRAVPDEDLPQRYEKVLDQVAHDRTSYTPYAKK